MSDIEQLLDQTARSAAATPSPDVVEADVLRGRSALRHRRRRRAIGSSVASTVAAAALVGAAVVVGGPDGAPETPAARPDPAPSQGQGAGVRLVAYTGAQPEGFIVDRAPEGWFIQGSDSYILTIAPNGDTTHPANFQGKLVVTLLSSSAPHRLPEGGDPVEVNGRPGVVSHDGGAADLLTFDYGDGRYVQVQAWRDTLNWSNEQLVRFAEGLTVTADAVAGHG